jgi:transposase
MGPLARDRRGTRRHKEALWAEPICRERVPNVSQPLAARQLAAIRMRNGLSWTQRLSAGIRWTLSSFRPRSTNMSRERFVKYEATQVSQFHPYRQDGTEFDKHRLGCDRPLPKRSGNGQSRAFGVAPVWWTPDPFGERSPRCRRVVAHTRRRFAGSWWSWSAPVVHRRRCPREFEPSALAIRNWVRQADRDDRRRDDGLTSAEREELRRPRREVKQLRLEREILAKASPGSLRRPTRSRNRLRVPRRESGRLSHCHDVLRRGVSLPAGTTRGAVDGHRPERKNTRGLVARSRSSTRASVAPTGCRGCMRS